MGAGGSIPSPPASATLRFGIPTTLTLSPGASEMVDVLGDPPAAYQIGFVLLGEPLDAWLDHAAAAAEPTTGRAVVELHAPSHATTFKLRASLLDERGVPGASADRAVAVSEHGFGAIEVVPKYAGQRPITEWTASVAALVTCKELAATLPTDPPGALGATAALGSALVVEDAPVGPSLAVVARAGHFAWGCADTTALMPGATVKVEVTVIDKTLDLTSTTLSALFRYDTDAAAMAPILEEGGALVAESFAPTGSKVGTVVLNGMAALVPATGASAFVAQRVAKGWDALAAQHFAAQSPGLRQRLEIWITSGLVQQSPSFEGLLAPSGAPDQGTLTITRFGSVDAAAAGVGSGEPLTWTAQPGDSVLMSSSLVWQPSRFAGAAALGPARIDFPAAASVAEALAAAGDGEGLAAAMGSFGTCDVPCVEQLCGASLAARFGAAIDGSPKATIDIKASAEAMVGDAAEPVALTGHFIGEVTAAGLAATVKGDLTAKAK